jgi:aminoglycoside 6'-N-acetyltransferase
MLHEPEVARWWGPTDGDEVRAELTSSFVVEIDGEAAGWLLFEENSDPHYRSVGLDISLATAHQGQGHGRRALRLAIDHFTQRGHHRFTIDPALDNERAIRCYTAVGFEPVGVLRAYERTGDGPWHDNLLMDLLSGAR